MRDRILWRFFKTRDEEQFSSDINDISKELGRFCSSFCESDWPIVIFMLQAYANRLMSTDEKLREKVDALNALFDTAFICVPKKGGTGDGV